MTRFISGIMVLVTVLLLFGCSGVRKDLATEDESLGDKPTKQEPVNGEEKNDHAPSETAYFFSEGLLLGSFDQNGWHSLGDTSGNLNGDGRYELIIKIGLWEGSYKAVFAQNPEGTYKY